MIRKRIFIIAQLRQLINKLKFLFVKAIPFLTYISQCMHNRVIMLPDVYGTHP